VDRLDCCLIVYQFHPKQNWFDVPCFFKLWIIRLALHYRRFFCSSRKPPNEIHIFLLPNRTPNRSFTPTLRSI
jgi:hypothetical protein